MHGQVQAEEFGEGNRPPDLRGRRHGLAEGVALQRLLVRREHQGRAVVERAIGEELAPGETDAIGFPACPHRVHRLEFGHVGIQQHAPDGEIAGTLQVGQNWAQPVLAVQVVDLVVAQRFQGFQPGKHVPPDVLARFLTRYGSRLTEEGELIITSEKTRDQPKNRADCLAKVTY